ncbi:MAG: ABC transporter permease [Thermoplasmata archaeon]|nr:MAG: ABC transporter permease [Thermoplasmata archaeon]
MSAKDQKTGKARIGIMHFTIDLPWRIKEYFLQNWKHIIINIFSIIFVLVLWYVVIQAARGGNQFLMEYHIHLLPTPQETWTTFVESLSPEESTTIYRFSILDHATASIWRVLVGFTLACLVGIPSGLLMGRSRYAADFGGPLVELIRPIPPLAWIGVGLLVFTFNVGYFIVFIGVLFPTILSTINGVKAVDEGLIEAAKTLGAKKVDIFRKVIIPGSMPSIVTGMRIGLGIGWMSIVAAEMVGMRDARGLGNYLLTSYDSYSAYDKMIAGMLFIGFIGWLMNFIIQKIEKRVIRWQE